MKPFAVGGAVLAGAAVLGGAFLLFGPESRVEAAKASWRRLVQDQGQVCFDLWSNSLRDPTTAQLTSSHKFDEQIDVRYRATNAFGAFDSGYFTCPMKNGKVDSFAVVMQRNDEALNAYREFTNTNEQRKDE